MSTVNELTEKRAKAQSYFDRYPERKGQGPYVPKAKLVHSPITSKTSGGSGRKTVENDSRNGGITHKEQLQSSPLDEKQKKDSTVDQNGQQRSRIKREPEEDIHSVRQWHSRKSERASVAKSTTERSQENGGEKPTPTLKQIRDGLPNRYPSTTSSPLSTNAALPASSSTSSWSTYIGSRSQDSTCTPFQSHMNHTDSPVQRRTESINQSSRVIPSTSRDVKAESTNGSSSKDVMTTKPLLISHVRKAKQDLSTPLAPPRTRSKHSETASKATSGSLGTTASVPSIDEIIGRHTPTYSTDDEGNIALLQPEGSSPFGRRPSTNTVNSYSSGEYRNNSGPGKMNDDSIEACDGNVSDDSLDSVELEIKNSLRINTPTHNRTQSQLDRMTFASLSPALQASFNQRPAASRMTNDDQESSNGGKRFLPHPMAPSISAPALIQKKSTPALRFSKVDHSSELQRDRLKYNNDKAFFDSLPRQKKSSMESSQGSDSSMVLNVPSIHRSKSSADLIGGARLGHSPFYNAKRSTSASLAVVPPVPALPNKRVQKSQPPIPPSKESEEAKMIRQFVHSTRLTQLITLSRLPYSGKTISFADVGDAKGHAVVVFMGLGAVRYLVGLYDEMASALGLRLICIDRWGIGRTDDLPSDKRGVLEWSNVVAEVVDRLEIEKFSILAHSAGAPYAMATTLMHSNRLIGPVHLLAPWVSPVIESGYKWLRYIPDGVIRTAQAAEWRMQGWKLGVNTKSNTSVAVADDDRDSSYSSSRDDFDDREADYARANQTLDVDGRSNAMMVHTSFDSSLLSTSSSIADRLNASPIGTSPSNGNLFYHSSMANETRSVRSPSSDNKIGFDSTRQKSSNHKPTPSQSSLASLAEHYDVLNAWQMRANGNVDCPPLPPPKTPTKDRYGQAKLHENGLAVSSSPNSGSGNTTKTSPLSVSDLPTELLKASHAESGGASNDLLVILGRSSQKPWGFAYTDVDYPVRVWHGEKDERINVSSVLWMEREMTDCQVTLVKNANHSLMTNVNVVVEALESISSYSL